LELLTGSNLNARMFRLLVSIAPASEVAFGYFFVRRMTEEQMKDEIELALATRRVECVRQSGQIEVERN
jgi:hypothetical protein